MKYSLLNKFIFLLSIYLNINPKLIKYGFDKFIIKKTRRK